MKENMIVNNQQTLVTFSSADKMVSIVIHLDTDAETVWLNLVQIADLFSCDKSVISHHLKKIVEGEELDKSAAVASFAPTACDDKTSNNEYFNLDTVLSVGYQVNSKRVIEFRRWVFNLLKDYLLNKYDINKNHFVTVDSDETLRCQNNLSQPCPIYDNVDELSNLALTIIHAYDKTWWLLNAFDEDRLPYLQKHQIYKEHFSFNFCLKSIYQFKEALIQQQEASPLFGNLRDNGLDQILGGIHQTFDKQLLYPSVYERAAHLFYFTLKDHPFTDGNKRIGSFLLLLYLAAYNISLSHISKESLVALALLVARSDPQDKNSLVKLILNLITQDDK